MVFRISSHVSLYDFWDVSRRPVNGAISDGVSNDLRMCIPDSGRESGIREFTRLPVSRRSANQKCSSLACEFSVVSVAVYDPLINAILLF